MMVSVMGGALGLCADEAHLFKWERIRFRLFEWNHGAQLLEANLRLGPKGQGTLLPSSPCTTGGGDMSEGVTSQWGVTFSQRSNILT